MADNAGGAGGCNAGNGGLVVYTATPTGESEICTQSASEGQSCIVPSASQAVAMLTESIWLWHRHRHGHRHCLGDITPAEEGSQEATFAALAKGFSFEDKVELLFINGQTKNLEDLHYYFSEEEEVDAFVAVEQPLKGPEQRLQVAHVRHAWVLARRNGERRESHNTGSSTAEPDDMPGEGTLKEVEVQFRKRHRMKYPVE